MIEYFTALIIAYNLQGEQIKTVAWFKSQSHCQTVMNENLAQPLYDHIYDLYCKTKMAAVDSRQHLTYGFQTIKRRRKCLTCDFRASTVEVPIDLAKDIFSEE